MKPAPIGTKEAVGYKWNKKAGTGHKLGGDPEGLSEEEYPLCNSCNSCNSKMTFYAQIDSIGDKYDLADCMVIHQFVCFDCFEASSQLTQTIV